MTEMRGKVELRRIEKFDLGLLKRWRNLDEIKRYCRQTSYISMYDQEKWFEKINNDPTIEMYAIEDFFSEDDIVGVCGLTSIDYLHRRAEFSLYICPPDQRKGFAINALTELFKIGFNDFNLHLIWGETFAHNPAQHLFEKLGMVKEGIRRDFYFKEGKYIDAILYSIKRDEFKQQG